MFLSDSGTLGFLTRWPAALGLVLALVALPSPAQPRLPAPVEAALARDKVPRESVALLVVDADGSQAPRLAWRTQAAMNPASIMKLVSTYAALDLLGPAFVWRTPVYTDGRIIDDTLHGNLYLRGQGDPSLVLERLWLLLRRVQGLGIRHIAGDIVLDRSAFDPSVDYDPAAFDGEPLRPYNTAPDALLLNFKSVLMRFVPAPDGESARVIYEPPLAGVRLQTSVPRIAGACGDWRGALQADFSDPLRIGFGGGLPAACGEINWSLAYADPRSYAERMLTGLWTEMGGQLRGQVREGRVPEGLQPVFELVSPPLAEVVRDINKYSNNAMAQQLFLTLGLQLRKQGSFESAREVVQQWWSERVGADEPAPLIDKGSGLSREARISASALGRMLQLAWKSPVMPDLVASLPAIGVDGTLKRRALRSGGSAHLKSGSLRDVSGIAGYVDGQSGRRYVLVAIANGPNAAAARAAFDALVDWSTRD